ncbi:hypothetical protein H920_17412 [Fukomys damarensis]|uniref:Uncharacterized protein n=1 Tax=Fukomys damarensis TaxID=885580 RepID=A0A091CQ26_FUKDA|nr:hypothetical protein H920_17412 [Fukomys damarensis]
MWAVRGLGGGSIASGPAVEVMDVGLDLAPIWKFSCLGATCKDLHISELQLLSFHLNLASRASSWAGPAGTYRQHLAPVMTLRGQTSEGPLYPLLKMSPSMETQYLPMLFIKMWQIRNSGGEVWPPGVCAKYVRETHLDL